MTQSRSSRPTGYRPIGAVCRPRWNSRIIGDAWIRAQRSLALRVPSAVVPEEYNLLVNPVHPRFSELRIIGSPEPVVFDPRLFH